MTTTHSDPELALLRAAGAVLSSRRRADWEMARRNLYTAIASGDADMARRWLDTLEGTAAIVPELAAGRAVVSGAIAAIRGRLADTGGGTRTCGTVPRPDPDVVSVMLSLGQCDPECGCDACRTKKCDGCGAVAPAPHKMSCSYGPMIGLTVDAGRIR